MGLESIKMKKHFSLLTSFFLAASLLFAGCGHATGSAGEGESQTTEDAQTQTSESTSPSNSPEQPSESDESSALSNQDGTDSNGSPVVYFTSDISAEGMLAIYKALDWTPTGRVAVKLSTGEPPASNYLDPQLIMYSTALGATALVIRIVSCTVYGIVGRFR